MKKGKGMGDFFLEVVSLPALCQGGREGGRGGGGGGQATEGDILTFSPLRPASPFKPGRPEGPWKEE